MTKLTSRNSIDGYCVLMCVANLLTTMVFNDDDVFIIPLLFIWHSLLFYYSMTMTDWYCDPYSVIVDTILLWLIIPTF